MEALTKNQILRRIKRITSDLCDLSESRTIQNIYWDAIRSIDTEKLNWFWSLGETTRHRVMNANDLVHGKKYGFNELTFDEHGWLDNQRWTQLEEIELRLKDDKAITNRITLARGLNESWTYGLSYNYGPGSGGGWAPSVYCKPIDSREACLNAALEDLRNKMEDRIQYATKHPDPSNYNVGYMKKVLQKIGDQFANQVQLALF